MTCSVCDKYITVVDRKNHKLLITITKVHDPIFALIVDPNATLCSVVISAHFSSAVRGTTSTDTL